MGTSQNVKYEIKLSLITVHRLQFPPIFFRNMITSAINIKILIRINELPLSVTRDGALAVST